MEAIAAAEAVTAFIPAQWLVPGGATVLLGVVFLMVVRGFLVPRSTHEDMRRERDEWKQLALTTMKQNGQLLQGTRVVTDVLSSFPPQQARGEG